MTMTTPFAEGDHIRVYGSGIQGVLVEWLGDDVWIAELRIPDTTLVGDIDYRTVELRESEFEGVE